MDHATVVTGFSLIKLPAGTSLEGVSCWVHKFDVVYAYARYQFTKAKIRRFQLLAAGIPIVEYYILMPNSTSSILPSSYYRHISNAMKEQKRLEIILVPTRTFSSLREIGYSESCLFLTRSVLLIAKEEVAE